MQYHQYVLERVHSMSSHLGLADDGAPVFCGSSSLDGSMQGVYMLFASP